MTFRPLFGDDEPSTTTGSGATELDLYEDGTLDQGGLDSLNLGSGLNGQYDSLNDWYTITADLSSVDHDSLSGIDSDDHHVRPIAGTLLTEDGSNNFNVDEGSISHQNIDQATVQSDDHHAKYTDLEARTAVEGDVNVEDLTTQGANNTVPVSDGAGNLTMTDIDQAVADAPVDSVFGRTGDVTAQNGDYSHSQLSGIQSDDHHTRYTDGEAAAAAPVDSVFGRTGPVTAQSGDYSHSQLSGIASDDHHSRYEDFEARSAVIGNVNVEDLVTAGSAGTVPTSDGNGNLTMQSTSGGSGSATGGRFFNSPFYALSDGDFETIGWIHVGAGDTVDIQEVGVRNDLNNVPTGLNVVIQDITNGTEELSRNTRRDSGSPLVTLSGEASFEVRVENNTGSTQAGIVYASAEGAASGGTTDRVDVLNNGTSIQADAPALDFRSNIEAVWNSTESEVNVDLADNISVTQLAADSYRPNSGDTISYEAANGASSVIHDGVREINAPTTPGIDMSTSGVIDFGNVYTEARNSNQILARYAVDSENTQLVAGKEVNVQSATYNNVGEYEITTSLTANSSHLPTVQTEVAGKPTTGLITEVQQVDATTFRIWVVDDTGAEVDPPNIIIRSNVN
jgi:hypothetical protein